MQALHRVFVEDCAAGPEFEGEEDKLGNVLGLKRPKIMKCKDADASLPIPQRLAKKRATRSDALSHTVVSQIIIWYRVFCKYNEVDQTFYSILSTTQLWDLYCRHHDINGKYWVAGTMEWLSGAPPSDKKSHVISYPKFSTLRPKDVKDDGWRTCCCQICLEVDEMVSVWYAYMLVSHGHMSRDPDSAAKLRSTIGGHMMDVPACNDPACDWWSQTPAKFKLPPHQIQRFKNVITDYALLSTLESTRNVESRPPFLFCGSCECGICESDTHKSPPIGGDEPAYLNCRGLSGSACNECGWANMYPVCPTLAAWEKLFSWRCLGKTAKSLRLDVPRANGGSRKPTDLLVKIDTNFATFANELAKVFLVGYRTTTSRDIS